MAKVAKVAQVAHVAQVTKVVQVAQAAQVAHVAQVAKVAQVVLWYRMPAGCPGTAGTYILQHGRMPTLWRRIVISNYLCPFKMNPQVLRWFEFDKNH